MTDDISSSTNIVSLTAKFGRTFDSLLPLAKSLPNYKTYEHLILSEIFSYSIKNHKCFITSESFATKFLCSAKTIQRATKILQSYNLINIEHRWASKNKSNKVTTVNFEVLLSYLYPQNEDNLSQPTSQSLGSDNLTVATQSPLGSDNLSTKTPIGSDTVSTNRIIINRKRIDREDSHQENFQKIPVENYEANEHKLVLKNNITLKIYRSEKCREAWEAQSANKDWHVEFNIMVMNLVDVITNKLKLDLAELTEEYAIKLIEMEEGRNFSKIKRECKGLTIVRNFDETKQELERELAEQKEYGEKNIIIKNIYEMLKSSTDEAARAIVEPYKLGIMFRIGVSEGKVKSEQIRPFLDGSADSILFLIHLESLERRMAKNSG